MTGGTCQAYGTGNQHSPEMLSGATPAGREDEQISRPCQEKVARVYRYTCPPVDCSSARLPKMPTEFDLSSLVLQAISLSLYGRQLRGRAGRLLCGLASGVCGLWSALARGSRRVVAQRELGTSHVGATTPAPW